MCTVEIFIISYGRLWGVGSVTVMKASRELSNRLDDSDNFTDFGILNNHWCRQQNRASITVHNQLLSHCDRTYITADGFGFKWASRQCLWLKGLDASRWFSHPTRWMVFERLLSHMADFLLCRRRLLKFMTLHSLRPTYTYCIQYWFSMINL